MKKLLYSGIIFFVLGIVCSYAQDDLLKELVQEESAKPKKNVTTATFKGTTLINSHTVELTGKGNLQFIVSHRFGSLKDMKGAFYKFLGLNQANTYLSLEYGATDFMSVGLNYTPQQSIVDGNLKFKVLRQQTGVYNIPLTIDVLADVYLKTGPFTTSQGSYKGGEQFLDRMSYLFQVLFARKFTESFSLQLMPTMVHYNAAPTSMIGVNDIYSIGIGGRYKITERIAITAEYFRQLNGYKKSVNGVADYVADYLSVGVEFDTGGHIFQIFASNSPQMLTPYMFSIGNTTPFYKGDIRLGFNLNRAFGVVKKKAKPLE